jgi:hypothetical protein
MGGGRRARITFGCLVKLGTASGKPYHTSAKEQGTFPGAAYVNGRGAETARGWGGAAGDTCLCMGAPYFCLWKRVVRVEISLEINIITMFLW